MSGFPFSSVPRRRLHCISCGVFVGATGLALLACSSSGPPEQSSNAPIVIQTSQLSVLIENKVGMPLTDVDVAITPIGGVVEYTKFVGRIESAEKRDVSLGAFSSRDGTPFNLRVVRPKTVRVTAKDLTDKAYKVERSWE